MAYDADDTLLGFTEGYTYAVGPGCESILTESIGLSGEGHG